DGVYVERLIRNARHIEVQIICDHYGAISHLWERECTIQRRNQKLIEVAPSPSLNDALRTRIIDAAKELAAAANYDNLGTFEFLVDNDARTSDQAFASIRLVIQGTAPAPPSTRCSPKSSCIRRAGTGPTSCTRPRARCASSGSVASRPTSPSWPRFWRIRILSRTASAPASSRPMSL